MIPLPNHSREGSYLLNDSGVGIVAVIMIVAVLSLMGGMVTYFVATGTVAKTNDLVREQAFDLVHAGFEYALKRLDDGVDPDGDTKMLGSGQFTVGYDGSSGVITVSSDVSAMYGTANPTYTIQGPTSSGDMADCLEVGTTSASLQVTAGKTQLQDLTLQNTCTSDILLTGLIVTTNPSGSENINLIRIGTSNVYNQTPGVPMGDVATFSSAYTIASCSTDAFQYIRFNATIPDRNYNLTFVMQDGTQKTAFVQFVADDESACLNVDLSSAYVGGTGSVRLLGGTLTNSCEPPTIITVSAVAVTISPTSPSRDLTAINFNGGGAEWTGSVESGVQAVLSTAVDITGLSSVSQDYFGFSGDMRGYNYSIVYTMSDSTNANAAVALYEADMDPCLNVDTSGTSTSGKKVTGQAWYNTCSLRIVVDQVQTSWTGLPAGTTLKSIKVNGTGVWSGTENTGVSVDIDDVDIVGSGSAIINDYTFSKNTGGGCLSHVMTLFDGGTVSVPSYCP